MLSTRRTRRWGPGSSLTALTGLETAITAPMTFEQIDAYVLHVRIEEITLMLSNNDVNPGNRSRRSPSAEPKYDSSGRRINTRYRRYREHLEEERDALVQLAISTIPMYRAPRTYDYRRQMWKKHTDKVYIPVNDLPEINFIGQLLGPRGRSLVDLNKQSGATIVIRGKGSVKDGKCASRRSNAGARSRAVEQADEPLHCLITADTQAKVDMARKLVQNIIETIVTEPSQANTRKQQQLRDLAIANGTFRDDERRGVDNVYLQKH